MLSKQQQQIAWTILKIGLALLLIWFVLRQTNLQDVITTVQDASIGWAIAAVVAFGLGVVGAIYRTWHLLNRHVALRDIANVTIVQIAVGNLVATSVGMISYVSLLRGRQHASLGQCVASLVFARLADLLVLVLFLTSSTWTLWDRIAELRWFIITLSLIGLGIFIIIGFAFWQRMAATNGIERMLTWLGMQHVGIFQRGLQSLNQLVQQPFRHLIRPIVLWTMVIQLASVGFFWCSFAAFGVVIEFWPSLLILSLTQVVALIPVQVMGGLGLFDLATIILLAMFGLMPPVVAPALVGLRIIFYGCNLMLLAYPLIELRMIPAIAIDDRK
jgi:uncharacterized membrane protein YbhN (UPF0104 family)